MGRWGMDMEMEMERDGRGGEGRESEEVEGERGRMEDGRWARRGGGGKWWAGCMFTVEG